MTRRPARCVLVALAVLATSCSGGDDEVADTTIATAPLTTPAPAPTTAPPTTAPPTTVPPTTTTPPATAPQTTAPPPTAAPATTTPLDLRGTIERDVNIGEQALFTIGANPSSPDAKAIAAQYFSGTALENVLQAIDSLVAENLVTQPNPDVANMIVVTTEPVVDASGVRATAETCRIDATWVLALSDDSNIRVPINTTVAKIVSDTRFTFADGIWKLDGGNVTSREEGVTSCA